MGHIWKYKVIMCKEIEIESIESWIDKSLKNACCFERDKFLSKV